MTREEAIKILKALRVYECYPKSASEETKEALDMAIEALSEETSTINEKHQLSEETPTDLISRAEAIKAVENLPNAYNGWSDTYDKAYIIGVLEDVPSAESEWIPCSERLPEQSNDYICTIPLDEEETFVKVLTFHNGRFYEDDDEWGATFYDDVIAWMPLPKPFEGSDDGICECWAERKGGDSE